MSTPSAHTGFYSGLAPGSPKSPVPNDAQNMDVLSMPGRCSGKGHDIPAATLLQGLGHQPIDRLAGGGKGIFRAVGNHAQDMDVLSIGKRLGDEAVHHFAGADKMMARGILEE